MKRTERFGVRGVLSLLLIQASASAQSTERVSVATGGGQGDGYSGFFMSISPDGRFVGFMSASSNLVPGDTNGTEDAFVHDRQTGVTERVSVATNGTEGNGASGRYGVSVSADGRFVAFDSYATNFVANDTDMMIDVFVHDRLTGSTVCVSADASGAPAGGQNPAISADGRFVAFAGWANFVADDTNGRADIYVRDLQTWTIERVSIGSAGEQANVDCWSPCISADGRFVAFETNATTLVPGLTDPWDDVFVHDRLTGVTECASRTPQENGVQTSNSNPSISADGRFIAFARDIPLNPPPYDRSDIFVHDRVLGTTERVSATPDGSPLNASSFYPVISADGRFVLFVSNATDAVPGDANSYPDVFLRDRSLSTTEFVSVSSVGTLGNSGSDPIVSGISGDGRLAVFNSFATNLVDGDTNAQRDIFVRDRGMSGFPSLCEPGVGGVAECPCSNPPSGAGRGCDNSFATGGAALSASGLASLSMDNLVFTTSGEKPMALSILLQGNFFLFAGVVYGQGVRCVGGTTKRLFSRNAVAGSVTVPDFGAGDPTISARSAAKGDTIQSGQSRWYLVFYRDPAVLGGCPGTSTFNATQTRQAIWAP